MPDIAMCRGRGCPIRCLCYRFRVTPDPYWQSMGCFDETPRGEAWPGISDGECKDFQPVGRGDRLRSCGMVQE